MKAIIRTLAVVAIAVTIGVSAMNAAFAQEPNPTPETPHAKRQAIRAGFFARVAENLNVSLDQLKAAFKDAELQTVDQLESAGTVTSDQAAKVKDRINNSNGLGLRSLFSRIAASRLRTAVRREIVNSGADAIGIAPKDLRAELLAGKSIADVAGEHNVSLDTVKTRITSDAKAKLDQAVANGRLTQQREDAALQKLNNSLDDILNRHRSQ